MKSGYRFTLVLSVCLLLLAPIVVAQTTGTIEGTVTDQNGGALPGVTVEITSPNLQGTRTATTGNDGRFRFPSVPPGPYKVTSNLSGMGTSAKNANVTLDSTATVNLQMQVSAKEAITVTGEAPLIDTASTTTGSNYSAKVMDKLPLARNYASIVLAQPGVQTDVGETQGRALAVSIYGSTSAENLWIIDGVNTTNVIKGLQGKAINGEFIQEVEVKTGGYQAEYGRTTGGVVNVITKSGGNEFHGDLFGYYNRPSMSAKQRFDKTDSYSQGGDALNTPGYVITPQDRREGGVDLGGFALKDHIWFFGAFDRTLTDDNVEPLTGALTGKLYNQHFISNLWAGKLTFNVAQGTTIVGTIFADPQTNTGALLVPTAANPAIPPDPATFNERRDVGGSDYAGRLNQLFGSFGILTAQYSHHTDRFTTLPAPGAGIRVTDTTLGQHSGACPPGFGTSCTASVATGGPGNIFGPTINNQSKRDQYSGSFTGYAGNMEIKLGGDYQKDDTFGSTFRTGGQSVSILTCTGSGTRNCNLALAPTHTNPLGDVRKVFYQHSFYTANATDLTPLVTAPFDTPSKRTGAFLQDQWRIIPTLTINFGVRWDQDESDKGNGEVAFKLKNEWAPRAGIVWDFVGDGTSKLYASAGRFYYSLPTDLNARVFTANTSFVTFNYSPTSLIQDPTAPRGRTIQTGTFDGEPVDPNLKAPYQDEYTIGVEKALDPTLSIGLKGTYRTLGRTVEDRCDLDYTDPLAQGSTCAIFNPGSRSVQNGGILSCNESVNPTDPQNGLCGLAPVVDGPAKRIFRGIELTARKQFSQTLWAQASYLYSTLRGNYSGAIREGSGQTDPGINADFDYNQFNINGYGSLELDRPHQFRVDAVYNAPFGLAVGVQAYARSGIPASRLGYYNGFYPDLLYLDQRGSNGRLPTDYEANLSLAYNVNIGPVTVTPQVYIFNVLNRQTITGIDERFNPNGSFVTTKTSPFYGQGGVEPGKTGPDGTLCPASSSGPCSDNQDYRKATTRVGTRLIRAALKITF
jgi:Carboxypeptidase regulatory-like domain/TonB dependent receptor/TonB-dependent Receptor Plug Domain